jgi:hypothetical protein
VNGGDKDINCFSLRKVTENQIIVKEVIKMAEKVKDMDYKEAWGKCQTDYLVTTGAMYKYLKDTYGEETLVKFLESDASRYKNYFKGFVAKLAHLFEMVAPGKAFEQKMREVAKEFQWYLGVGNIKILELNSEKSVAEIKLCPYERALVSVPKGLDIDRDFYCTYQCNVFMKEFCKEVLGFEISFEPKGEGCIYRTQRT